MSEIRRLPVDQRFETALGYRGRRVRLVITSTTGSVSEHNGWVASVARMLSGTTDAVIALRTDQERIDKDLAFSLALVSSITDLGLDGRPIKENENV